MIDEIKRNGPVSKSTIAVMAALTPEQAQNYLNRWKSVHEAEIQELRNSSLDIKVRQLSILMESRDLFGKDDARDKEVDVVRERWARIRGALGG